MNEGIKTKLLANFQSKAELARHLGVSRQQVNHWFNGDKPVSFPAAKLIAEALGIDWTEIRADRRK
jgi:transcriptional regulator with XRE-family HTH domain